jgi:putative acetyltransferase
MIYKEFNIRPATNEDIPSIKNMVFAVLREFGLEPSSTGKDKDLDDIEQNYFTSNGYFGVAIDSNTLEIVGTFGLYACSKDICELRKMYLLPYVRGKGLGKCMLTQAIAVAKEKHFRKIVLETISPLKAAIELYKQFGFKEVVPAEINERVDKAFTLNIR